MRAMTPDRAGHPSRDPHPAASSAALAGRALRERYRAAGLRPSKRLGQHFLADLNLARKIIAQIGPPDAGPVLEIGAGLGALTFLLAEAGYTGIAVEVDRRLADWLDEALAPWPHMKVVEADIRTFGFTDIVGDSASGLRVVGNLPYYLTSEILFRLKHERAGLARAIVMVQDDVADRLLASPGSRTYGSLTVAMALDFTIEPVLRAPRQAFWPAPDVDSAVLRLTPHAAHSDSPDRRPGGPLDPDRLERVVRAGFAQRRKTLGRALAAGLAIERSAVEEALRAIDLDPGRRAETLAPDDFVRVARALAPKLIPGNPPAGDPKAGRS